MKKLILNALLICAAALFFAGCAQDYARVSKQFLAPGQGRIYFFRGINEAAGGRGRVLTEISLNDEAVGTSAEGCFFYVDKPAGDYFVRCRTSFVDPQQHKHKLTFTLAAGETKYVHIWELPGIILANAEPVLENEGSAVKILADCWYTPVNGPVWPNVPKFTP